MQCHKLEENQIEVDIQTEAKVLVAHLQLNNDDRRALYYS